MITTVWVLEQRQSSEVAGVGGYVEIHRQRPAHHWEKSNEGLEKHGDVGWECRLSNVGKYVLLEYTSIKGTRASLPPHKDDGAFHFLVPCMFPPT